IAFVTDIGQLMDKSFNQGTWEGVEKYAKDNKKSYKYYQPANGSDATDDDRYDAMKAAIDNGAKVVVCAGFMQQTALTKIASENKNVSFIFIDGYPLQDADKNTLTNVAGIAFMEEQSGYLAGYACVKEGYTKLGFSGGGGGTNPACQRFGYGFIQGANDAAKEASKQVTMKYSWKYGESFSAGPDLQTMLEGWYSTGTEVVFSCGGSMCNSAFAAAKANNGKVVGVDVDQSSESDTVITSATKGLQSGTMWALAKFYAGKFSEIGGKGTSLGAADDAVCLPEATWSLKNFTVDQYKALFAKVKAGTITIDNDPTGAETKTYSNVTVDYVR
ncbi:MAG: BMP family ABC transporter substrate-binding protein, partial [Bacilli bacterium]|nr:BMP family ABC transporter substrate-binding protein [Bacilli bacterium]